MKNKQQTKERLKKMKQKNSVLKKENQMLKVALFRAENASKNQSVFLSHMSHDIRTPMNGIIGMTDIAVSHFDDKERVLDCLEKIDRSSRYLVSLVNDILDMSRIENGKLSINYEPMDMHEVVDSCVQITDGMLTRRNLELVREFGNFRHPGVVGDALHLRQVLINILGNAIKFTPDGGKVFFRAEEVSAGEGKVLYRFDIEDTGIGMKADFLETIWDSFTQEGSGNCGRNCSRNKGTGLGMAITKRLVDLMGGNICVESELGIGSRFSIELAFDIGVEESETEERKEVPVSLAGMKVLLVEDDEISREIAQTMLEDEGVCVVTAENGKCAVNSFNNSGENEYDAILMDIRMPIMDGLSATEVIRTLPRQEAATIPIIAMTADAYEEDIQKTKVSGMNAHLAKPVSRQNLLRVLGQFRLA